MKKFMAKAYSLSLCFVAPRFICSEINLDTRLYFWIYNQLVAPGIDNFYSRPDVRISCSYI